jgi:hypothetical protein
MSLEEERAMKGTRPGHLPQPSRVIEGQRECAEPGCSTRLSVYNARNHCWQHADIVFPNYRGKRLAPNKA